MKYINKTWLPLNYWYISHTHKIMNQNYNSHHQLWNYIQICYYKTRAVIKLSLRLNCFRSVACQISFYCVKNTFDHTNQNSTLLYFNLLYACMSPAPVYYNIWKQKLQSAIRPYLLSNAEARESSVSCSVNNIIDCISLQVKWDAYIILRLARMQWGKLIYIL